MLLLVPIIPKRYNKTSKMWGETTMKVGFLGAYGTFSEIAVKQFFAGRRYSEANYANFTDLIHDAEKGLIDYAMLPVENTTTGIIYRTYDLLKDSEIYAVGEQNVRIDEHLIVIPGAKLEDIREVYTHPEPIEQCQGFFKEHPWIRPVSYQDTAKSVEYVKQCNDPSKAALASWLAAENYGLPILLRKVQDNHDNITRFFCVTHTSRVKVEETANKISMYFVVSHEPGALFKVIEVFARHGINMLKLESRPIKGRIFEYCFYIDFDGNVNHPATKQALKEVAELCLEMKVLGCYKQAEREENE